MGVSETAEGLGRHHFLTSFFGAIAAIANPPRSSGTSKDPVSQQRKLNIDEITKDSQTSSFPWDPGECSVASVAALQPTGLPHAPTESERAKSLTDYLPDPGYFLAGGTAGVVSRTATAPLDRLKVYLIAQTGVKDEAVQAVKSGAPVQATKLVSRPLIEAAKTLWGMGGIRSLFAGEPGHLYSSGASLIVQAMASTSSR